MPNRKDHIDTGQSDWSAPNPRFSYPVQSQSNSHYSHQDGYPTPVATSHMGYQQAGPSRSRRQLAVEMEIDGMEHKAREMTINEPSDDRVGVEKPCEWLVVPGN
jgi:hypothetical protein